MWVEAHKCCAQLCLALTWPVNLTNAPSQWALDKHLRQSERWWFEGRNGIIPGKCLVYDIWIVRYQNHNNYKTTSLTSQKSPQISPLRISYIVCVVRIWKEMCFHRKNPLHDIKVSAGIGCGIASFKIVFETIFQIVMGRYASTEVSWISTHVSVPATESTSANSALKVSSRRTCGHIQNDVIWQPIDIPM